MVKYSKTKSRYGWQVNKPAIQAAVDELDIRNPVYIIVAQVRGMAGNHDMDTNGNHVIKISDTIPATSATFTLWHELAHAMQEERHLRDNAGTFAKTYNHNNDNYHLNQYEIEANKIAYEKTVIEGRKLVK